MVITISHYFIRANNLDGSLLHIINHEVKIAKPACHQFFSNGASTNARLRGLRKWAIRGTCGAASSRYRRTDIQTAKRISLHSGFSAHTPWDINYWGLYQEQFHALIC